MREKKTIYNNITYKELLQLKKAIPKSFISAVPFYDGFRYALYKEMGGHDFKLNLNKN